jgi:hypothetical protein
VSAVHVCSEVSVRKPRKEPCRRLAGHGKSTRVSIHRTGFDQPSTVLFYAETGTSSGHFRISISCLINISFNLSEFGVKRILGEMIWGTYWAELHTDIETTERNVLERVCMR